MNGYLLFTPTDRLRMRLGIDTYSHTIHSMNEKALPYDYMGTGFGYTGLSDFHRDIAEHLVLDVEPDEEMDINSQNLLISCDVDRFKLESITTHRVQDMDGIYDPDFSAGGPMGMDGFIMFEDTRLTTWTEELRLASTNTTGLRWVGQRDRKSVV